MKQCDNGHFYDETRFDSCPYCQEGAGVGKTAVSYTHLDVYKRQVFNGKDKIAHHNRSIKV